MTTLKLFRLSIAICAIAPAAAFAQRASFASINTPTGLPVQRFDIDWPHSAMEFTVRFMGLSNVRGAFGSFGGTLMYNPKAIEQSSVSVNIDAKSINTNVEFRDKDLKSANFFDVEKYPLITFHSEKVEKTKDGFIARGPLTMHGVTKPVAINFTQIHPVSADAWGNKRVGFLGHLSLNRKDYGILGTKFWNSEYDPGKMSISDNVDIDLTLEAEVNQVERWTAPKADSLLTVATTRGVKPVLADLKSLAADTTSVVGKNSAGILSSMTVKLMHRGKYDDAIEAFRLATELHADASWAYAGLGEAYLMTGRRTPAIEQFRKALAADSTNTVAYEYLRYVR
jgi:polyisoprenoid-binding protein YceI